VKFDGNATLREDPRFNFHGERQSTQACGRAPGLVKQGLGKRKIVKDMDNYNEISGGKNG
jgi:hypothetical protein